MSIREDGLNILCYGKLVVDEESRFAVTEFHVFAFESSYSKIYRRGINCELFPGIITNIFVLIFHGIYPCP
jgi:hypothetical protein